MGLADAQAAKIMTGRVTKDCSDSLDPSEVLIKDLPPLYRIKRLVIDAAAVYFVQMCIFRSSLAMAESLSSGRRAMEEKLKANPF